MERMHRRRQRRTADEVASILRDLDASGVSQREFAASRGIPLSTLCLWRRRRRERTAPALIPVRISGGEVRASFEVVLSNGRAVKVPSDFDPEALDKLIRVLESC